MLILNHILLWKKKTDNRKLAEHFKPHRPLGIGFQASHGQDLGKGVTMVADHQVFTCKGSDSMKNVCAAILREIQQALDIDFGC